MPSNTWDYFKTIVIIQIFFGVGVTMVQHAIPSDNYVEISSQLSPEEVQSMQNISDNLTNTIEQIKNPPINLPIVDTAFILFYTGNLVIDAFINSLFAIPSMISGLINAFSIFIPIDPAFISTMKLGAYSIVAGIYILGIIAVILNLRSQGGMSTVV